MTEEMQAIEANLVASAPKKITVEDQLADIAELNPEKAKSSLIPPTPMEARKAAPLAPAEVKKAAAQAMAPPPAATIITRTVPGAVVSTMRAAPVPMVPVMQMAPPVMLVQVFNLILIIFF